MSKKSRERRRALACEFAAIVLAGRTDENILPVGWSLAVFFERYMAHGGDQTMEEFGPKEPTKLGAAK